MNDVGVVHGRFQPLHTGHMEYLLAAKAQCRKLIVGITNPDPSQTLAHEADPKRGRPEANPFTYYERLAMLDPALREAGVSPGAFAIVPFPINFPDRIQYYAPRTAKFFVTIYDQWGESKAATLRSLGLDVEILWRRTMAERFTTGAEVRALMASDGEWQSLVPAAVAEVVTREKLVERLRRPKS